MPVLNWIGKEAVVKHHKDVPFRLIEPVEELGARTLLSASDDASSDDNAAAPFLAGGTGDADMSVRAPNLIVEGDNLHALKALLPRYAGQVKCIYIDPPYNTGNEGWAYNDNVKSPEILKWLGEVVGREGETLDRHDRWLCMMYPRLLLLKQFLREDGAIFVSIDDNEVGNLRLLMDEIFGGRNFIATIAWQRRISPDARLGLSQAHDHILVFGKNSDLADFHSIPLDEEKAKVFKNPDKDVRGEWVSTDFSAQGWRPNQMYKITTPGGTVYDPPAGRCWKNVESVLNDLVADGRMWFGNDGKGRPRIKTYLSESTGVKAWTWWTHQETGNNQEGKKEINEIIGHDTSFDTPKPTRLLRRILQIATDKDSLILDSFAGSGTTGHAVLKQNTEDGGNRRFILVEMDPKIAKDVTAERVRRVAKGYTKANGERVEGLGGGFQYCRLSAEPLFDAGGAIRKDVTFAQLAEFVWFMETGAGKSSPPYEGGVATVSVDGVVLSSSGDQEKNHPTAKAAPLLRKEGSQMSPLLGTYKDRAVFLLFNGILKDRSDIGGNVLNGRTLEYINALLPKGFEGERVIYAARSRFDKSKLAKMNFTFHQLPYDLAVKTWF